MTAPLTPALQELISGVGGAPNEDSLKTPVANFLKRWNKEQGQSAIETVTEISSELGRYDMVVTKNGSDLLVGVVELKDADKTIDPSALRGHDKAQFERFLSVPNLLYTNGLDWILYQHSDFSDDRSEERKGVEVGRVSLRGDKLALLPEKEQALDGLLRRFLGWKPYSVSTPRQLARVLAPLARLLRDRVAELLERDEFTEKMTASARKTHFAKKGTQLSAVGLVFKQWDETLVGTGNMTPADFADGYAQTVAYALLLKQLTGQNGDQLEQNYPLLAEVLQSATSKRVRSEIGDALSMLEQQVEAVDVGLFAKEESVDPWTYFYEDFLGAYDPVRRKELGVYYTPAEVVQFQVRLTAQLLEEKLGKAGDFANEGVRVIDPAMGTGAYLNEIVRQVGQNAQNSAYGALEDSGASGLAGRLSGFELLVGPYTVANLQVQMNLQKAGGGGTARPNLRLADTLASPYSATPTLFPDIVNIVKEHEAVQETKLERPLDVVIGNPPYKRGKAEDGGWLAKSPLMEDYLEGVGKYAPTLRNLYVYFWRWAMWRLFEDTAEDKLSGGLHGRLNDRAGVVSYIVPSSFLQGPGFASMREKMRVTFDEIYVVDLGGDSRGGQKSENVFAIQTPVCICVGVRTGRHPSTPARMFYHARANFDRAEKLRWLKDMAEQGPLHLPWDEAADGWQAPFTPAAGGAWQSWPALEELLPFNSSGVKAGRTWPVAETKELLERRWAELLKEENEAWRKKHFVETNSGRHVSETRTYITSKNAPPPVII